MLLGAETDSTTGIETFCRGFEHVSLSPPIDADQSRLLQREFAHLLSNFFVRRTGSKWKVCA